MKQSRSLRSGAGGTRARTSNQSGFTVIEVFGVLAIVGVVAAATVPNLQDIYMEHKLESSAIEIQSLVQQIHMNAVKEKTAYRLIFHDESADNSNWVEVQRNAAGTFVTLVEYAQDLPDSIDILGGASLQNLNSVDQVTVGVRGECAPGRVYLHGSAGGLSVITINRTCLTELS